MVEVKHVNPARIIKKDLEFSAEIAKKLLNRAFETEQEILNHLSVKAKLINIEPYSLIDFIKSLIGKSFRKNIVVSTPKGSLLIVCEKRA